MDFLIGVIFGLLMSPLYTVLASYLDNPYQWKCPVCSVRIKTNSKAWFEQYKVDHTVDHMEHQHG